MNKPGNHPTNQDELIDKILDDLYRNANRAMDFYDEFCMYENDVSKLDATKNAMEKEGLIVQYKNKKTGISPLGFKICFDGGYMNDRIRRERNIRKKFQRANSEIALLRKKQKRQNIKNTVLLCLLLACLSIILLMAFGVIDLRLSH